jgi:outer membrane protein TolC
MKRYIITLFIIHCSLFIYGQDSLNGYLEAAAQNNPGVQAAFHEYEAALQKMPQAGAYQDPQLDVGFFLQPMELVEGRQVAEFKLMQMFPWFGTRKAARTEAQHNAQMAFERFRETRDQLFLDVYAQWFTLCRLKQQLVNHRENKKLLQQLEELALQKFSAGGVVSESQSGSSTPRMSAETGGGATSSMQEMNRGQNNPQSPMPNPQSKEMPVSSMGAASSGMSAVLLIQLEIAELDNNIESVLSEINAEKAKFNALLNRTAESEIVVPCTLQQVDFLLDIHSVMRQIAEQNPMLGMWKEEEQMYKAKALMERKMSYPMFGTGLQYMLINKSRPAPVSMDMDGSMNPMNGKDMLMPMVSISIPIYRGKYKAQQRESAFLQQASRDKHANTLNMLEAELYRSKHNLDDAARKISLYRKQTELAQSACNLTVQEFVTGKGDLTNVIQVQRQLLDYKLKTAEATAVYNTMVANIQKLISSKNE